MKIKKTIEQILERVSIDNRFRKKVKAYKQMKEKYLSMNDEEFSTEYVEITAKYEYKRTLLTVVIISIVISTIMNVWSYLYDILIHVIGVSKDYGDSFSSVACILIIIIFLVIAICGIWVIYDMSKNIYNLNKKRLYLEEIKTIRTSGV